MPIGTWRPGLLPQVHPNCPLLRVIRDPCHARHHFQCLHLHRPQPHLHRHCHIAICSRRTASRRSQLCLNAARARRPSPPARYTSAKRATPYHLCPPCHSSSARHRDHLPRLRSPRSRQHQRSEGPASALLLLHRHGQADPAPGPIAIQSRAASLRAIRAAPATRRHSAGRRTRARRRRLQSPNRTRIIVRHCRLPGRLRDQFQDELLVTRSDRAR